MQVPDHQCPIVAIDATYLKKQPPVPDISRTHSVDAIDIDQLAAILARILGS